MLKRIPVALAAFTLLLLALIVFQALLSEENLMRHDLLVGLGWAYIFGCYNLLEWFSGALGYTQSYEVLLGWRTTATIATVTVLLPYLVWLISSASLSAIHRFRATHR